MKNQKQLDSENEIAGKHGSPDVKNLLDATVKELGKLFPDCRCLLYPLEIEEQKVVVIEHESAPRFMPSLLGQHWSVSDNPLFTKAQNQSFPLIANNAANNSYLLQRPTLRKKIIKAKIHSWLILPIRYQKQLLGGLELHGPDKQYRWQLKDLSLIGAVANSIGAALSQANVYHNLIELNDRLAAVERVQNNLIAIVGHELRTPLSTIKICLESLATEPTMPADTKNIMLDTALQDTDRLERLIQSFLTVSKLEAGRAYRNIEATDLSYALNLALCRIQSTERAKILPKFEVNFPQKLPLVLADIDGLIEVLVRLLDNACKFTPADGEIAISVAELGDRSSFSERQPMLEVAICDTGRGIESDRLKVIFNRFAQSEDYLRRSTNGVGLGLVIASKIIESMGGKMWACSNGKDRGSQFHFTIPIEV